MIEHPTPRHVRSSAAFAVGTGKCGTHLLYELFAQEFAVLAHHELNPVSESFHRYCCWNGLTVDERGFLAIKADEISRACLADRLFFESSGYLSLSVGALFREFGARFILLTRHPLDTICSLWSKGWYEGEYRKDEPARPVGYHDLGSVPHFFGRLVPNGPEYVRWAGLSRAGKLAWYWSALNRRVLEQFRGIPTGHCYVLKVEDLTFETYVALTRFLGVDTVLTPAHVAAVVASRPGASLAHKDPQEFGSTEVDEILAEAGVTACQLGYDSLGERCEQASSGRRWKDG
jgi:hypothetical protein